jgi:hypothetical protein
VKGMLCSRNAPDHVLAAQHDLEAQPGQKKHTRTFMLLRVR